MYTLLRFILTIFICFGGFLLWGISLTVLDGFFLGFLSLISVVTVCTWLWYRVMQEVRPEPERLHYRWERRVDRARSHKLGQKAFLVAELFGKDGVFEDKFNGISFKIIVKNSNTLELYLGGEIVLAVSREKTSSWTEKETYLVPQDGGGFRVEEKYVSFGSDSTDYKYSTYLPGPWEELLNQLSTKARKETRRRTDAQFQMRERSEIEDLKRKLGIKTPLAHNQCDIRDKTKKYNPGGELPSSIQEGKMLPRIISCPHCGEELELDDSERRSGKLTCPVCGKQIDLTACNHSQGETNTTA
jgi:hypothetical protein